jgi:hypothetical protein
MVHLIVEYSYDPPLTDEQHNEMAARLDKCLEAHGARWLASYLAHDRKRMVCEFEAPDAESVRASLRSANVKFERAWSTEVYRLGQPHIK